MVLSTFWRLSAVVFLDFKYWKKVVGPTNLLTTLSFYFKGSNKYKIKKLHTKKLKTALLP